MNYLYCVKKYVSSGKLHSTNWKGYYFNFFAIKRVKYFFLMESCIFLLIDIDYKKIIKSFIIT